ncbi:hypothetical protein COU58_03030 [Candidatus Pacearchaeota archaeon CG10_big_fil_rev_8_21_14_0_10_32_42]|nr:MAG: hypothetical protein COU58_03030 [Candidatus Pacearchaeota archaeon CG10_big_fil_rev_8_21_14_0_10_32_42]
MEKFTIMVTIGMILLVLIIWGLIGSSQVSEIGNTCDIGIDDQGNIFCWTWHRNMVGDIQDNLNNFFDGGK